MEHHRRVMITGNWKMYKTLAEASTFVKELTPFVAHCISRVGLAVPFTMIESLVKEARYSSLWIGAQNMNDASEGAFTGEISAKMLLDVGAKFVLLGHSERRRLFHEDNAFINRKVKRAVSDGLLPVLCVGETEEEHESGRIEEVLREQLTECLKGVEPSKLEKLILAYEPVWAIGTGIAATPDQAEKAHAFCRQVLGEILSQDIARKIIIQYGGSVNGSNARSLLAEPDIDGFLIGGASLSLENFKKIIDDSESILKTKVESV